MECRGRVVHGHDQAFAISLGLSVDLRNLSPGNQRAIEKRPSVTMIVRIDHLDLPVEVVRRAGSNFVRHWVTIAGRTALDDVGDEDALALESGYCEKLVQGTFPPRR